MTCCKVHKSKICTLPVKEDVTPDNQYQYPTEDTVEIEKLALLSLFILLRIIIQYFINVIILLYHTLFFQKRMKN